MDQRIAGDRRSIGDIVSWIAARTRFFDDAVVSAIAGGVRQIVILGAGYDGRALRFRTPGVRFFEVDHPATQRDKRRRLDDVGASTDGIAFVAADFTEEGLAVALVRAGHDRGLPTQFLCEGVLRYLPEQWFRALLRVAADASAPASRLAVSISTSEVEDDGSPDVARERLLAETGEPVLTVPPRDVALQWLVDTGWTIGSVDDVAELAPGTRRGRILVRAGRGARGM